MLNGTSVASPSVTYAACPATPTLPAGITREITDEVKTNRATLWASANSSRLRIPPTLTAPSSAREGRVRLG